jgi:D-alanyl-lipoteichoic acid acyltransferase DltB (MBOAT superfamily)
MDNIYLTGLTIAIIFLVSKFFEMRFITKENKPLKTIIVDTIFVYFSVIFGYFIIQQFNLKTQALTEAPVFVDNPKF